MELETLKQLAISLGLGLLLGLQRERVDKTLGGIRTFPLISLLGTVSAMIARVYGGWILAAGLLALTAVVVLANYNAMKSGSRGFGGTTEVAALLLYAVGAYVVLGDPTVAVVVGGCMAVLLEFKDRMHAFARAVGEQDMRAIVKFAFLSLVILPVLPDQTYGPYSVLNPFKIWLMVVLIVGMSFSGYVTYKLFSAHAGSLVGGLLGGAVSSTATTVSFSRRTAVAPAGVDLAAVVIMIASTVSFARVLIEIAVVAPGGFRRMALPLFVMALACIAICAFLFFRSGPGSPKLPEQKNPAELKSALFFGAIYAVVLLGVAAAKQHFGSGGLYVVAVISGLTDMDAITLSTADLVRQGRLEADTGWRTILLASMANFAFKFGCVAALGHRQLILRIGLVFAAAVGSGAAILAFWPM